MTHPEGNPTPEEQMALEIDLAHLFSSNVIQALETGIAPPDLLKVSSTFLECARTGQKELLELSRALARKAVEFALLGLPEDLQEMHNLLSSIALVQATLITEGT